MIGFVRTEKGEKMDDLISRQAAKDAFMKATADGDKVEFCWWVLDGLPTIEPIRCGECIHHDAEICLCYYHNMPTTDGWFCADGERLVK